MAGPDGRLCVSDESVPPMVFHFFLDHCRGGDFEFGDCLCVGSFFQQGRTTQKQWKKGRGRGGRGKRGNGERHEEQGKEKENEKEKPASKESKCHSSSRWVHVKMKAVNCLGVGCYLSTNRT